MTFTWRVGVDWDHDGFINWDYETNDDLNDIESLAGISASLDYSLLRASAVSGATVSIASERTAYGLEKFTISTTAGTTTGGIDIFEDSGAYDIATTAGTYTFVIWVKPTGANWVSGDDIRVAIYDSVGLKSSMDIVSLDNLNEWTRVEISYTVTTETELYLRVRESIAVAAQNTIEVTGLMVFKGATKVPQNFNAGGSTLQFDIVSEDVQLIRWFTGIRKAYVTVGDEPIANVTLKNVDGKYSLEDHPLYSSIVPGRRVEIAHRTGGGANTLMSVTYIDTVSVPWGRAGPLAGRESVVLNCRGYKILLDNEETNLGTYTNFTADEVLGDILDIFSLDKTALATGDTTFVTYGDSQDQSAGNIMREVIEAERGRGFWARDGRFTFWNRQFLLKGDQLTVTATVGDNYKVSSLNYQKGALLSNVVRVTINPRKTKANETLWEVDRDIFCPAGEIIDIECNLRRDTGEKVAGSSLAKTGETWAGASATTSITTKGHRGIYRIDNSAGTTDVTLTGGSITGDPVTKQNSFTFENSDATSIANYGKRGQVNVNLALVSDFVDGQDIAKFELRRRKDVQGDVLSITYRNMSDGFSNRHQYEWDIGTRLTLKLDEYQHERDYFIIGEDQQVSIRDNKLHTTTFYLEPADNSLYWILGTAGYSELGSTTILGY